ncbi:MAG: chemotaxis protein CheD [Pseudomonadota bacterium]
MAQLASAKARPQGPVPIGIGDLVVSGHPSPTFTTVLGSCIAVGLWDPEVQIGGLNHYLLADSQGEAVNDLRYGDAAIPALFTRVRDAGADPRRMKAIIVGGANIIRAMLPIGTENANFARDWLAKRRIPLLTDDTGGSQARRVSFTPSDGTYRITTISDAADLYS